MRVNFHTLGCRLNEAETESWAEKFQSAGYAVVRTVEQADLVVLNTCAVTNEAGRKSRQMIRRLQRGNPNAKIIISGCYSTLNSKQTAALPGVDLVVDNRDKDKLVDLTCERFPLVNRVENHPEINDNSLFTRGRQRAFIKVQDGCRYRCAFCIVTHARGGERSRTIDDIVPQVSRLQKQGINEIILTGVHLGGYGSDTGNNLYGLIKAILEQTEIPRIRLGSLEPWALPERFFELFDNPRLMPHLHLPLQSGSDSVLRRMARRCKTEEFVRLTDKARESVPDINITTDIIVGFPGETEQEWLESFDVIRSLGFGQIHIFSYSARLGTRAFSMPDQVSNENKKKRSQSLHRLAHSMKQETFKRHLGREFPVLWEKPTASSNEKHFHICGYTPNFLRVSVTLPDTGLENTIETVCLNEISECGQTLKGTLKARTDISQSVTEPAGL